MSCIWGISTRRTCPTRKFLTYDMTEYRYSINMNKTIISLYSIISITLYSGKYKVSFSCFKLTIHIRLLKSWQKLISHFLINGNNLWSLCLSWGIHGRDTSLNGEKSFGNLINLFHRITTTRFDRSRCGKCSCYTNPPRQILPKQTTTKKKTKVVMMKYPSQTSSFHHKAAMHLLISDRSCKVNPKKIVMTIE